jgi:hypothetical protein
MGIKQWYFNCVYLAELAKWHGGASLQDTINGLCTGTVCNIHYSSRYVHKLCLILWLSKNKVQIKSIVLFVCPNRLVRWHKLETA